MRFLLTRLYDWMATPAGALVTRKDPLEYLRKLRFFGRDVAAEGVKMAKNGVKTRAQQRIVLRFPNGG